MNDKELADKVVALGVGLAQIAGGMPLYSIDHGSIWLRADEFLRRWAVAGALMEKVYEKQYSFMVMQMPDEMPVMTIQAPITTGEEYGDPSKRQSWASQVVAEPLPRAIIEACVEALDTVLGKQTHE
ncbi:hypothetical protein LCGC14_2860130 [marine sediment metagenome]|uniref:Uncharacterized protein n=1 Tax=marine sediment metagenome TaxID=412755 RepID=A0A0F8Y650_9ZZZZ